MEADNEVDHEALVEQAEPVLEALRGAVEGAKTADQDDVGAHLRTALGEVQRLHAAESVRAPDLHDMLLSAVIAPSEEVPYFLNRASEYLDRIEARYSDSSRPHPVRSLSPSPERAVVVSANSLNAW